MMEAVHDRGIYCQKEKRFTLEPPKKRIPYCGILRGNRVSDQCYVIICGQVCDDCHIKKYLKGPKEEEDVQWEVKIEPSKNEKADTPESQEEAMEVEPSEQVKREPLIAEEKADECHPRPRRSRKKPQLFVPDDPKITKRSRSPSLVVLSPEQKKAKKKKNGEKDSKISPSLVVLSPEQKKAKKKKNGEKDSKIMVQVPTPCKLETMIVDMRNGEKESSPEYESNDIDESKPPKQKQKSEKDQKIIQSNNEVNCDAKLLIEPKIHQIVDGIEKKTNKMKPGAKRQNVQMSDLNQDSTKKSNKNVTDALARNDDFLDTGKDKRKAVEKAEKRSALLEIQKEIKKKSKKNSKAKDKVQKRELNVEEIEPSMEKPTTELEQNEEKSASRPSRRRKSKVLEDLSPTHQTSDENDIAPRRKKSRRSKSFVKENKDLLKIPFDLDEASEKSDETSEKVDDASASSLHDESIIKELENQNLIEIANPVGRSNCENNDEKDESIALSDEKEVTSETVNKESGDEKLRRMSMKLEAQEKMIQALLAAQTSEHEVNVEAPPWWDHSAQREPLLVKMSWEQIAINVTEQYPEVAQEVANNQDFEDMLNLDQNVEDSGVASDIVFRYFHLLEKVSFEKKVKAVRPFQFMSEPVKRKNVILRHKLNLKDYEDSLPQSYFENVDLIFALVVMDLNRKSDHILGIVLKLN